MRTTTTDGVEIHYTVDGDGPPIVLVHGITDSSADWSPVAERLAHDHTVLALDLRGHGQSGDAADYGALAMAEDVAAAVSAARVDAPLVIGHSLGAAVAAAYAANAPTRAVVAIDQSLRLSDFAATIGQLEHQLKGSGFHPALRAIFNSLDGAVVPDDLRQRLAANREAARPAVVLGVWELIFESKPEELDAIATVISQAISVPFLAIHGNNPGLDYPVWLGERIPQAEVEVWDEHGHYPHLVDPARFLARLSDFEASLA